MEYGGFSFERSTYNEVFIRYNEAISILRKVKEFNEDSFLITGYELGLRGVEDMCFVLKTKENKK